MEPTLIPYPFKISGPKWKPTIILALTILKKSARIIIITIALVVKMVSILGHTIFF